MLKNLILGSVAILGLACGGYEEPDVASMQGPAPQGYDVLDNGDGTASLQLHSISAMGGAIKARFFRSGGGAPTNCDTEVATLAGAATCTALDASGNVTITTGSSGRPLCAGSWDIDTDETRELYSSLALCTSVGSPVADQCSSSGPTTLTSVSTGNLVVTCTVITAPGLAVDVGCGTGASGECGF